MKLEDYRVIVSEVPYLESSSPYVSKSGQVIYVPNNAPMSIHRINGDYANRCRLEVNRVEMFSNQDMKDDFSVRSQEEIRSVLTMTTKVLTILLACIGGDFVYRLHLYRGLFG